MVSLTLDPKKIFCQTIKREDESLSSQNRQGQSQTKFWYTITKNYTKHLQPLLNFPQQIFEVQRANELRGKRVEATDSTNMSANHEDDFKIYSKTFNELSHPNIDGLSCFIEEVKDKVKSRDHWTQVFAYTDFSTMPVYASILALAATAGEESLSARKVFAGQCRTALRERGISETILDSLSGVHTNESSSHPLSVVHMIACLEERKATDGYLEAALHFEQLHDTRSALACVYRNVRYRLRDNQLSELDNELKRFDVSRAGINIMLAVLTSTAPLKSKLTNRRRLFREFKAYLKKSGQLEKGLLDDLK